MNKTLVIVPSLKFGWGAEKIASIVGTELNNQQIETHFFTFYDTQEKYPFQGKYFSLQETFKTNLLSKIIKLFSRAWKIKKYCKQHHIQTCVSFMEDANFSTILSKLIFRNKSHINISIRHSLDDYGTGIYYFLIKWLYPKAEKIIVLTEHEQNHLINHFSIDPKKITIIHNPIDINSIEQLKIRKNQDYQSLFGQQKFTFISMGRLTKIKNQQLLIDVFKQFYTQHPDTQLLILGDWELRENLLQQIGDHPDMHLLGNQSNVYPFLYQSNCFILTSFSESFWNAIIEAMACELPIISTKTQWWVEITNHGEYGLIFQNREELLKYMQDFYSNNKKYTLYQKKSLQRARDFDIKSIIEKWKEKLYSFE